MEKLLNLEEVYELEDDYWWFKAKRYLLVKTVKNIANKLSGSLRLLDGGCGAGANLKALEEIAPSVGIEKYDDGIRSCKKRNIHNIIRAELEQLPFKNSMFDIILAMDTLEHVYDDRGVMQELHRAGKKNAYVLIHVPAFMFLWSEHDIAVDHRRRYTLKNLAALLKSSHFQIITIHYRLNVFFILGLLRKYFIKIKRFLRKDAKITAQRPQVGRCINSFLYRIIVIEDALMRFFPLPFGLSIFCIARKKG